MQEDFYDTRCLHVITSKLNMESIKIYLLNSLIYINENQGCDTTAAQRMFRNGSLQKKMHNLPDIGIY